LKGLPYRVGRRRRIDVRWVDQWLAAGGYRPYEDESRQYGCVPGGSARYQKR
jgi:hypothetical protein